MGDGDSEPSPVMRWPTFSPSLMLTGGGGGVAWLT